jgi:hypothetical protein
VSSGTTGRPSRLAGRRCRSCTPFHFSHTSIGAFGLVGAALMFWAMTLRWMPAIAAGRH